MSVYTTIVQIAVKVEYSAEVFNFKRIMDLPFSPCSINREFRIGIDVENLVEMVVHKSTAGWSEVTAHPYTLNVKLLISERDGEVIEALRNDLRYSEVKGFIA